MLVEADPVTDAIAGLRAKGHTVEPCGEDPALWRIDNDDQELTVEQRLALALHFGLVEGPGRAQ